MKLYRNPPHLLFPFGGEPIIFDTLLFVREACQVRGLEVGGPCHAERGLGVETHCFVFEWDLCDSRATGGYVTLFFGGLQNEPVPPKAWGSGGEAPGLDIIVNIHIQC